MLVVVLGLVVVVMVMLMVICNRICDTPVISSCNQLLSYLHQHQTIVQTVATSLRLDKRSGAWRDLLIGRVQKRASRLLPELAHLEYEEIIRRFQLLSLHYRKQSGDMTLMLKTTHGLL